MRRLVFVVCFACVVSIAVAAVATEPPPPDVEFHPAATRPGGSPPLSEAVRLGDTLYLSGQLGVVPGSRELAPGGIREESRQVMENVRRVLEKHGHTLGDLVKCTVMLADMADWPSFNEVYRTFFPDERFPARSAFGVSGLALGARVEVECIAAATRPVPPPPPAEPAQGLRPIEDLPPDPEPEEDPPLPPPPPPPPPSPPAAQILGYTACAWGSAECNRCVPDVHAAMSSLRTHGDVAGFNMGPAQDVTVSHHWQGIQRLGYGDGKLMAVSRSGSGVAFVMVEMGSRAGDGLRYRSNRIRTDLAFSDTQPPGQDVVIQEFPIDAGFNHAGGIQVVGKVLAVPYENSDNHMSRVAFFDVGTRQQVRRLHQTELSSTAVYQDPGHAGAVAVGKLADQRYLMIVAGYDSGTADFYLSSTTSLLDQSTTWSRFFVRSNGFDRAFQAINLVTQCDGKLFLVGNYNTSAAGWGTDYFRWYELSNGTGSSVNVTLRGERHMVCTYRSAQQCNLVAAGGTYVDPQGRLLGYSTEHDNDGPGGSVKMEEFRGEFPQACPTIDTAWAELYDDAGFGDRSVMIDFPDRALRNYENYDQVEGFEDKTSSARWCIPSGWRLRLYEHKNPCGGTTRDLIGTGSRSNYDDVGFGDDASCSRWFNF